MEIKNFSVGVLKGMKAIMVWMRLKCGCNKIYIYIFIIIKDTILAWMQID